MAKNEMYHHPSEGGYWSEKEFFDKGIRLEDKDFFGRYITPIGIEERSGDLCMVFSTFEGEVAEPIKNIRA